MRPDWNQTFLEICAVLSKRSTCRRRKTAAILVRNRNIISIGYNGVPSGEVHCEDMGFGDNLHREWSSENEIHGEINALLRCEGSAKGAIMYTVYSPCTQCAKAIVAAGISGVHCRFLYHKGDRALKLLEQAGIPVTSVDAYTYRPSAIRNDCDDSGAFMLAFGVTVVMFVCLNVAHFY